jgi:hypothetical protein
MAPFGTPAFLAIAVGALTHITADYLAYPGIPLLYPFSDRKYTLGILGGPSAFLVFASLAYIAALAVGAASIGQPWPYVAVFGLVLALLMGALVNSRKKFREDATRALLRPYNFFADIRDLRVMSGLHTTALMIILSLCSALLMVNLLYFFRMNFLLEKIILSFGSPSLTKFISYLAWNPFQALLWTALMSIGFFILGSVLIKTASFFIRNRVYFSSVFFTLVWSFLPLILLLPLGLVLYKVLNANVLTFYLFLALLVFTVWIFHRLMKGIYVIFDINPGTVYFYSLGFIILVLGSVLLYYQLSRSAFYYIMTAVSQYKLM